MRGGEMDMIHPFHLTITNMTNNNVEIIKEFILEAKKYYEEIILNKKKKRVKLKYVYMMAMENIGDY